MGPLRATPLGFQSVTSLSTAVGLTLPLGPQQASGSACNLLGNLLTVGGTVTGAFATGQVVTGTGIPANTYITGPGVARNTWNLSNLCTTETAEAVTAFARLLPDFAVIRAITATVFWRDDGTAPTAAIGMPSLTTDVQPFEYWGDLLTIQFISATGAIAISYYKVAG